MAPMGLTVSSRRFQPADSRRRITSTPTGLTGRKSPDVNVHADLSSHRRWAAFVEEYRKLLPEAGVELDERYMLWSWR